MREGVGVENSLRWVAARFAQRAVEDFFEGSQHREFVIDATTAIEFLAKAIVARHDVTRLYELDDGEELTTAQCLVLNPALGPDSERPVGIDREEALIWLAQQGQTINASKAVKLATNSVTIDVAAADRSINARNAAVHIGDIDAAQVDRLAGDFIKVSMQLWAGLSHHESELWGDLSPIAHPNYMKSDRTPVRDAEVRVVRARRAFYGSGLTGNRRSRLTAGVGDTRCPSCHGRAVVTTQPVGSAPERCIPPSQRELPVEVLDCLICGLVLFGRRQIDWASRSYPASQPQDSTDLLWYTQ
ncbi:MAG: hypothetical protein Q8K63_05980 [Acidimicrobiales bacterium]|nr:hypothetical protein [Acidimicrobiales bacterium]